MLNMKKNKILSYEIKDIKLYGYHGLYEKEIKDGQNFYIDIYYKNVQLYSLSGPPISKGII